MNSFILLVTFFIAFTPLSLIEGFSLGLTQSWISTRSPAGRACLLGGSSIYKRSPMSRVQNEKSTERNRGCGDAEDSREQSDAHTTTSDNSFTSNYGPKSSHSLSRRSSHFAIAARNPKWHSGYPSLKGSDGPARWSPKGWDGSLKKHHRVYQNFQYPNYASSNYASSNYASSNYGSGSTSWGPGYWSPGYWGSSSISASSSSSSSVSISSGDGSANTFHGKATFFTQGGVAGACGKVHQDSDFIVAIQTEMYAGGKYCGKTILVTRKSTGQSIKCIAADECPGCPTHQSLDLSVAAFNTLGTSEEGVFDIQWQVMD